MVKGTIHKANTTSVSDEIIFSGNRNLIKDLGMFKQVFNTGVEDKVLVCFFIMCKTNNIYLELMYG